jgi:PD-(D/E)XK endonuclease
VLSTLVSRGYRVLVPFGGGDPYDLAVDVGGVFVRVQCKTGWETRGCIVFNCRSTDHGKGALPYTGRADVFGVYFPPTRGVYLVPISSVAEHEGRLRLRPARNNQRQRTRPAADFEIDRWSSKALATLAAAA